MFPCSCLKKYQQYARGNLQARIKYKIIGTFLRQLSTELETAVTQKCEKKISVNIHLQFLKEITIMANSTFFLFLFEGVFLLPSMC